ncbi:hypothetical protein SMGES_12530 [Serratia marcescens]|nr:hypothetical protein SMGES_12530 [Serratia marcescens]
MAGLARHQRQQHQTQIAVFEQTMTPAPAAAPTPAVLFAVAAEMMAPAAMTAALFTFMMVMPV